MADDGDGREYERARRRLADRLADRTDVTDAAAEAVAAVPRHAFVPETRRENAYADRPLPIGEGQTISAPHMVAKMTALLDADEGDDVLEIGTGCGYHAAVTAEVVGADHVYSVEYEPSLAERARATLDDLGYGGISVRVGDGREGWEENAPYDAAYLTCAAPDVPSAIVDQIRAGGTIVAPLGRHDQHLVRAHKRDDGTTDRETHGRVRFVPLRGD